MQSQTTVGKRNNLTTSVTVCDELPVSDLFFTDKEPGIFPIKALVFMIIPGHCKQRVKYVTFSASNYASSL